jgi:hypothetical protein
VVVHSTLDDGREPPWVRRVVKGDVEGLVDALAVGESQPLARRLAVIDLVSRESAHLIADWREMCRWDPMLPPDADPPLAASVVSGLVAALERPQPLGWGVDPAMHESVASFARACGSAEIAVEELVCLRESLVRAVGARIPPDEAGETLSRLHMLVDRAILISVQATAATPPPR